MNYDPSQGARIGRVTGSLAAGVVGLSQYQKPIDVYRRVIGEIAFAPSGKPHHERGHRLQPALIEYALDEIGASDLNLQSEVWLSHVAPWAGATLDALSDDFVIEAKTARTNLEWGRPGTDQIPEAYYIQCQWNLAHTDHSVCYVPVLFGEPFEFQLYKIKRNDTLTNKLFKIIGDWHAAHVAKNAPPDNAPADGSEELLTHIPKAVDDFAPNDRELDALIEQYRGISDAEKTARDYKKELANIILGALGEYKKYKTDNTIVTRVQKREQTRFNSRAFKDKYPDLYDGFKEPISDVEYIVCKRID